MDTLFQFHKLNDVGVEKAKDIAEMFDDLLSRVGRLCQPGREFAIVKTKLEEACFYAKKSMAMNDANQL